MDAEAIEKWVARLIIFSPTPIRTAKSGAYIHVCSYNELLERNSEGLLCHWSPCPFPVLHCFISDIVGRNIKLMLVTFFKGNSQ